MKKIKFGTDGWRAVIDDDFTPENVKKVIQAFADIYPELPEAGKPVAVGYDRRKMSRETAELTAKILTANGIETILSEAFCPTPCVSWNVVNNKGAAGVMITASHNPPEWNGIKFKESYGGAASPEYTNPIENQINKNEEKEQEAKITDIPNEKFKKFDPKKGYLHAIKDFVDIQKIKDAKLKVLVNPMYGSGSGFIGNLVDVTEMNNQADPTFGGKQPEPIPPHINDAIKRTTEDGFDICLITDGDADRIGAVDEKGNFINPHQIFSLMLKHLVEVRGWRGKVIKSITTTRMLNKLCNKFDLELVTTPVGFKYISPMLNDPNVLIGGEESGGIGIPRHVCERDGVLNGLLLLEIIAHNKKPMSQLIEELQKEAGPFYYRRDDLHLDNETISHAKEKLNNVKFDELVGKKVIDTTTMDGYHFLREDNSWLLIRPSGTEPLLRTYAEARSMEDVEKLLSKAKELIGI